MRAPSASGAGPLSGRAAKAPPLPEGFTAAKPNEWLPIWDRVIATTPTKAVGYAVARFAGWGDGENIHPGNAILGRMCGCSDKTVRVALGQMREWGLMFRYHKGRHQGDADIYQLTFPDDALARVPLLGPDWELPGDLATAVAPTGAVAEAVTAVAATAPLRYELPPTSTGTSPISLQDDGEGFDLAGVEVAHAREVKREMDDPVSFEAHRQRQMDALNTWMLEHPEAS